MNNKFIIPILLLGLGLIALFIQNQTPSNTNQSTKRQQVEESKNNNDHVEEISWGQHEEQQKTPETTKATIDNPAIAKITEPPSTAVVCAKQENSLKTVACSNNKFVERYFTTDPTALDFIRTAWNPSSSQTNSKQQKISSTKRHTGSAIPQGFKELLTSTSIKIEENADQFYGAEKAVDALEKACGWDGTKGEFSKDPNCLKFLQNFNNNEEKIPSKLSKFFSNNNDEEEDDAKLLKLAPQIMDIVILSIRDLDFLEEWRSIIEPFHLILIQDGDASKMLKIPPWADFELHNRNDIERTLGPNSWIISQKDASIRNFGFLISRKRFIYTLDDDCLPVSMQRVNTKTSNDNGQCSTLDPKDLYKFASKTNPILGHLKNLLTPSTPYFFNTLYDGYKKGTDFVRGFPYSMRDGVPTAISHGLWLNNPDYDAPTQLLKPKEKNTNHVDTAVTIPAGVLYPMCSMNVAFDRKRIGPAFMQGLMGVGMPWARYDDMFAGWASKVVADHLAVGVKSGAPYIFHNKASNPFTNLKKEYKGLWWQEVVIAFCNRVQLPANATTPESAYRALAFAIRQDLLPLHPYFDRLATAMLAWVDAWEQADAGTLTFAPSRTSVLERKELSKSSEENNKTQQDSSSNNSSCVTYEQRYSECNQLLTRRLSVRREFFQRISTSQNQKRRGRRREAVLFYISNDDSDDFVQQHVRREQRKLTEFPITAQQLDKNLKKKWKKDLWLSTCSFIMEAATADSVNSGDTFLLVSEGQERNIPKEFLPLVKTHSLTLMKSLFSPKINFATRTNDDTKNIQLEHHLDLSASLFLTMNPQYNFVWVVDSASRFISSDNNNKNGGWNKLLSSTDFLDQSSSSVRKSEANFSSPLSISKTKLEHFWTEEESLDYHFAINENSEQDDEMYVEENSAPYDTSHYQGNELNKIPFGLRIVNHPPVLSSQSTIATTSTKTNPPAAPQNTTKKEQRENRKAVVASSSSSNSTDNKTNFEKNDNTTENQEGNSNNEEKATDDEKSSDALDKLKNEEKEQHAREQNEKISVNNHNKNDDNTNSASTSSLPSTVSLLPLFGLLPSDSHFITFSKINSISKSDSKNFENLKKGFLVADNTVNNNNSSDGNGDEFSRATFFASLNSIPVASTSAIFGMSRTLANLIFVHHHHRKSPLSHSSQDVRLPLIAMKYGLKMGVVPVENYFVSDNRQEFQMFHPKFEISPIYASWMSNSEIEIPKRNNGNREENNDQKNISGKSCLEDVFIYPVRM